MHEHQVDVVPLGPLRNSRLRRVEHQRGRGGAGVLGGVGIAEHDLHAPAGLGKAPLHGLKLDDLVKRVDSVLQVLHLLEERNHVEHRHVLLVRKGKARQLVHVGHVLRRLREGDDVASRGLHAVDALDAANGAEGVENLARHGLQLAPLAPAPVLANVLERAGVHERVLAELHLDQVEPKGLRLPDKLLQRAVCGAHGTGRGQRALNNA